MMEIIIIEDGRYDLIPKSSRRIVRRVMRRYLRNRQRALERDLDKTVRKEPPKPKYPLRWASEKQRRAYFATGGFGHGIPYARSHKFVDGWETETHVSLDGGDLSFSNDSPQERYITGEDQQPFHADTGWPKAASVEATLRNKYEKQLISDWPELHDEVMSYG